MQIVGDVAASAWASRPSGPSGRDKTLTNVIISSVLGKRCAHVTYAPRAHLPLVMSYSQKNEVCESLMLINLGYFHDSGKNPSVRLNTLFLIPPSLPPPLITITILRLCPSHFSLLLPASPLPLSRSSQSRGGGEGDLIRGCQLTTLLHM